MKKMLVLATVVAFAAPIFAGDKTDEAKEVKGFQSPRHEMMQKDPAFKEKMKEMKAQQEAKKAEMKAHKKEMKAREEKLGKLVAEYKKAKEGSKKQTQAREEIGKILGQVRDEQIAFRAEQIKGFEQRLNEMKARLEKEQTAEVKTDWVNKMTDRVIEEDGDLGVVLMDYGRMGKGGPQMGGHKGHHGMKDGEKGFAGKPPHFKGGHEDHTLPMPPAPKEEK